MKREVSMCDKTNCNNIAGGKCELCDQDVCTPKHGQPIGLTLGGRRTHMNLGGLICPQ